MRTQFVTRMALCLALAAGLVLAQGCKEDEDKGEEDTTSDPDVDEDTTEDTAGDTPADTPVDTLSDTAGDTPADTPVDSAGDTPADTPADGDLVACGAVIDCMDACDNDTTCITACIGTVCPASESALNGLLACVGAYCATVCADRTDPDCEACIGEYCADQRASCEVATC